jgi:hypothetical protein
LLPNIDAMGESNVEEELDEDKEQYDVTIHTPIQEQMLAAVYHSQVPGHIYLQAANMNPKNMLLASYLRLILGLIYKNQPRFIISESDVCSHHCALWGSHRLEMPVHVRVPFEVLINTGHTYAPGTWVHIHKGLFHGDLGCVSAATEQYSSGLQKGELVVDLVPCIPTTLRMWRQLQGTKDVVTGK